MAEYAINRFPICALVYYVVALMLGYKEDEAKSFGLARAIFFAAAKNGFKSGAGKTTGSGGKPSTAEVAQDVFLFAGLPINVVNTGNEQRAVMSGKPVEPSQFDKQVRDRFNAIFPGGFGFVVEEVSKKLSGKSQYVLNSKAVYDIYKGIRDTFREKSFYEAGRTRAA